MYLEYEVEISLFTSTKGGASLKTKNKKQTFFIIWTTLRLGILIGSVGL